MMESSKGAPAASSSSVEPRLPELKASASLSNGVEKLLKAESKAVLPENKDSKEAKSRTKYKTFILSDAVFEVEQRYDIKEIVGHGAYGVVWCAFSLEARSPMRSLKEHVFAVPRGI